MTYLVFALPLPMHPLSRKAGEAAECAARDGKYWQLHERLFQEPQALTEPDLLRMAKDVGLNIEQFKTCLVDGAADAVTADLQQATRLKVSATPTFFVGKLRANGAIEVFKRINGAVPFAAFATAVEEVAKL